MLMLILNVWIPYPIQIHLNTSHVNVNHKDDSQIVEVIADLNTSHVNVNLFLLLTQFSLILDLNTSHVNVNRWKYI